MAESIDLTGMNIPNHIAIIMDGNGRWAKKRFLPRNAGHVAGAKTVEKIIEDAYDLGVKYLTVYAFSTENWNRPDDEYPAYRIGQIQRLRCMELLVYAEKCKYPQQSESARTNQRYDRRHHGIPKSAQ